MRDNITTSSCDFTYNKVAKWVIEENIKLVLRNLVLDQTSSVFNNTMKSQTPIWQFRGTFGGEENLFEFGFALLYDLSEFSLKKIFKINGTPNFVSRTLSRSTLGQKQEEDESLSTTTETSHNEYCTINPSEFHGRISINMTQYDINVLERKYKYLKPGGHYTPQNCKARSRIAVVIPFRDREAHLRILLNHMHSFLTKQKLDYSIIVVEQIDQTMNRAKLLNVGFVEALKFYDWQCFLFHDVDVLPEDDRNLHYCPFENPRHMAVAVNKFNYKLAYEGMFGTSSALTVEQFQNANGFSNRYWGWGGKTTTCTTGRI
ncbi:hypothetical protein KIN20_007990 [Parelaphostrongylus tenuis]|uniref:Beta-1,4-N-acetylgalactosaminyltransferase n=1 Tax=Parelaphostrongylus tenuis TaxID=148309 RepID=A0AAD5QIE5_PARTN|nr:hypothetical protein KIN20_007990 [Parelaphostrongylus tenuis]